MKKAIISRIRAVFQKYLFSDELPLEARLLNTIYLIGLIAALATLLCRIIAKNNMYIVFIIAAIFVFVFVMMLASRFLGRYGAFRWIILALICDVFFPSAFFALGGVKSSMVGYFILSIVLVFFLTWGRSRIIFLVIHLSVVCLSYYLSSRPFFSGFLLDNSNVNPYMDNLLTIMVVGLCIGFMMFFQRRIYNIEKAKADSAGKDLEQRNKLLEVVNQTAEKLLSSDTGDLEKRLLSAMEFMSRCVDVERMYIWRSRLIDGKVQYEQQYEWLSSTVAGKTLRIVTGNHYLANIPGWDDQFAAGSCINGPVSSLSENERNIVSRFGIYSILAIPVFLQEKLWGFVSFDDCRRERTFSRDEVNMLRSGSLLLANAIVRNHNKIMIDARMRQQELMSMISQNFISKEPMDRLINNALRKMGEFMGTSRILVVVSDKEAARSHVAYTWISSETWRPATEHIGFAEILNASFPKFVPGSGYINVLCCNDIMNEYNGRYKIFNAVNLKSFIWAPVYVDGAFWGLISVEECIRTRTWSESDIQLVGTVSSAIAGAVGRDLIDKARSEALEQAVQASKAKGDFLANMSHEMRTPMNAIIGMTSIGKSARDIEKKDYAFEKIENASNHLLGVINDILDMSKIEANKFELSPVSFDFEKMLQKVVNVINFRIDERRQIFTVHIDEQIPRFLVGDDQRLAQVITNLLSNAVKFTPENGNIRLNTELDGEENGIDTIRISVSDTGIGISKEQQAILFTSFQQAESGTSRKFGGTGLGLAISKRIVELMGGRIWVESDVGKGSVFAFTIKAERASGLPQTSMLAPGVNIKNIHILAIDDSPEILELFGSIMEGFGINCDTAPGGEEAIALMEKKGPYDVYFVDWKMPGMDGIELTKRIKQRYSGESVVIMISVAEWSTIEKEAKEAGVDKFLAKPLFPSSIAGIINECLGFNSAENVKEETDQQVIENFEGYTMLLAEDVDINREIVITLLEPTALIIECAENGKIAVEKFAAAPDKYDMIFMDIQIPEMDGFEATKRIRAIESETSRKSVPIVAMTANVFREDVERCLAAGMNDHLGKPLDIKEVMEKLKSYLKP